MNAWTARPSRIVTQKQVISATRFVVVTRTVYTDTILIDRMHERGQLSDRQHGAACRLHGLFLAAGLAPRVTACMDTLREEVEDPIDVTNTTMDREDAKTAYRRNLRHSGPLFGPILDAMMHDQHPGVPRLATAQSALEFLADQWGMER